MPLTLKEIWYFGDSGGEEADNVVSEEDLARYSGELVEGKIPWVEIEGREDQDLVMSAAERSDVVVVSGPNYSIPERIALENIIAETQGSGTRLLSFANSFEEARSTAQSLEVGMGVVVRDEKLIRSFRNYFSPLEFELASVEIDSVRPAGSGWRCCLDTADIMSEGEGMLVGSSSDCYFLVHAESVASEFTDPRVFRVNAGPVSNYAVTGRDEAGLKTKYLIEMERGASLPILNHEGRARRATLVRNKMEYRPLVLVSAGECSILLQEAESVYLTGADGTAVSVLSLEPGDSVLAYRGAGGMHFGTQISEGIREQ